MYLPISIKDFMEFVSGFNYNQEYMKEFTMSGDLSRFGTDTTRNKPEYLNIINRIRNVFNTLDLDSFAADILLCMEHLKKGVKLRKGVTLKYEVNPDAANSITPDVCMKQGKILIQSILNEWDTKLDFKTDVKQALQNFLDEVDTAEKQIIAGKLVTINIKAAFFHAFVKFFINLSVDGDKDGLTTSDYPRVSFISKKRLKIKNRYEEFVESFFKDIYYESDKLAEKIHFVKDENDNILCVREINRTEEFKNPSSSAFDYNFVRKFIKTSSIDPEDYKQIRFAGFSMKINGTTVDNAYEKITTDTFDPDLKDSNVNLTFRFLETNLKSKNIIIETHYFDYAPLEVDTEGYTYRSKYACKNMVHSYELANIDDSGLFKIRIVPIIPFYFPSQPESDFPHSIFNKVIQKDKGEKYLFIAENLLPGSGYMRRLYLKEAVSIGNLSDSFKTLKSKAFNNNTINEWLERLEKRG